LTKTRLTAEAAKLMTKEVSKERKALEVELKRFQQQALSVLSECARTAMSSGKRYGVNDKDRAFMKFLADFLVSKGFKIHTVLNETYWPDNQTERSFEEIDEDISQLRQSTEKKLAAYCSVIETFGSKHPEFIEVYPWLIDAYNKNIWSSVKVFSDGDIGYPSILMAAEKSGFLASQNLNFQWEIELQAQLIIIEQTIDKHSQKLAMLENEMGPSSEFLTYLDLTEIDSGDYFLANHESPLVLDWDYGTSTMASIDYSDQSFCDENMLAWISDEDGQYFLEHVEDSIRICIETGKKISKFQVCADNSKGFNWVLIEAKTEDQIICPNPPIIKYLFELNGYVVKFYNSSGKGSRGVSEPPLTQLKMEINW
jgi:hypothetical protein